LTKPLIIKHIIAEAEVTERHEENGLPDVLVTGRTKGLTVYRQSYRTVAYVNFSQTFNLDHLQSICEWKLHAFVVLSSRYIYKFQHSQVFSHSRLSHVYMALLRGDQPTCSQNQGRRRPHRLIAPDMIMVDLYLHL